MKRIVFIGAGNLATNLACEMQLKGYEIVQVYSKTEESASQLAAILNTRHTTIFEQIDEHADLYIFSVKDAVLEEVLARIKPNQGLWVHTAGSVPMQVFEPYATRYGVFYPLQTFSKTRRPDFSVIPFFIEAKNKEDRNRLIDVANQISTHVYPADSEQRKYMHLAAVFANNFTNHLFAIAAKLVEEHGLPFDSLRPLIAETAAKIETMSPVDAQTGPAIRYDENIMNKQIEMLNDDRLKELYRQISSGIYEYSKNK